AVTHGRTTRNRCPTSEDLNPSPAMPRVLVIDDEVMLRNMLFTGLTLYGHQVTVAGSASEALERLQEMRPQVVIADPCLTANTGQELIFQLRQYHPETPVIIMSGDFYLPPAVLTSVRGRSCPLLRKPFSIAQLLHAIALVVLTNPPMELL